MPCDPWQSPQAGASLEPSFITRFPWNDLSYILNSEEWQSLHAVSLACSYQPWVSSGVCSRASNPAWQEVQSMRECMESCQASWSTVRVFSTPLTSMVPRSGLEWHSRQRSVLPVGMVNVTARGRRRGDQQQADRGQRDEDGVTRAHCVITCVLTPSAAWQSTHICVGWQTRHDRMPLAATGACDVAQSAGWSTV